MLMLMPFLFLAGVSSASAQPEKIVGSWKVDIAFANGETRSVRFDAQDSGKGSFTVLMPKPVSVGQTQAAAEWSKSDNGSITFSGPVQIPLGNVGLLRGKLVLRGGLQSDNTIAGEATFFRIDEETKSTEATPSKSGTFKATRVVGQAGE
jgi:hypothetical protein